MPSILHGGNATVELGPQDFAQLGLNVDAVVRGYGHGLSDQLIGRQVGDLRGAASTLLPLPALELLSGRVHRHYLKASGGRYPILTQGQGCLWSCAYCSATLNQRWNPRPLGDIAKEIDQARAYRYRHLWAVDNLLVDPSQVVGVDKLCETDLTWSAMTRPELIPRLGPSISIANRLTSLAMGLESASTKTL